MKLALHRSMAFSSGILVMAFVTWAWWDSTRWDSLASYDHWMLEHEDCGLVLSWSSVPPIQSGSGMWREEASRDLPEWGMRMTWPRYFRREPGESDLACENRYLDRYGEIKASGEAHVYMSAVYGHPGDWACYIPHWCLLAGMAPLWAGLLVWRARRRNRRIINHQSSNHQSECVDENEGRSTPLP